MRRIDPVTCCGIHFVSKYSQRWLNIVDRVKNYINENKKLGLGRTENVCCPMNCAYKMRILVSQSKRLTERQSHLKSQTFGDLTARKAQR